MIILYTPEILSRVLWILEPVGMRHVENLIAKHLRTLHLWNKLVLKVDINYNDDISLGRQYHSHPGQKCRSQIEPIPP